MAQGGAVPALAAFQVAQRGRHVPPRRRARPRCPWARCSTRRRGGHVAAQLAYVRVPREHGDARTPAVGDRGRPPGAPRTGRAPPGRRSGTQGAFAVRVLAPGRGRRGRGRRRSQWRAAASGGLARRAPGRCRGRRARDRARARSAAGVRGTGSPSVRAARPVRARVWRPTAPKSVAAPAHGPATTGSPCPDSRLPGPAHRRPPPGTPRAPPAPRPARQPPTATGAPAVIATASSTAHGTPQPPPTGVTAACRTGRRASTCLRRGTGDSRALPRPRIGRTADKFSGPSRRPCRA
ncbi:hypothetical protein SALBM217S_05062 [Streptomyces griseoloalbus]